MSDLDLDSPALEAMRAAGVEVVVPLVAQGELIGVLNLGPRRSERPYSLDDRRLLDNLAGNAAAAIRVAHLVRQQEQQARPHERIDQELQVAQLIQQQFLPQEAPAPDGWTGHPPLPAGTRGRRRLLRLHPAARGPDRPRRRRRHRQGRAGRDGDGDDPQHPAQPTRPASSIPASCSAGPTTSCAPRCRPTCSSPASTPSSTRRRARSGSPTPATTCRASTPPTAWWSRGPPACRWA